MVWTKDKVVVWDEAATPTHLLPRSMVLFLNLKATKLPLIENIKRILLFFSG